MRDVNRIRPLLRQFEELWVMYPDLRFGQLAMVLSKNKDLFYIEDSEMLERIREMKSNYLH